MGLLAYDRSSPEQRAAWTLSDHYASIRYGNSGGSSWSWLVGDEAAMSRHPVVYGCVSLIASRARLPVRVRGGDGKVMRTPRWMTHPNAYMDWFDLVDTAVWSLLLTGDWFLFPIRDASSRVQGVIVPHPRQVWPHETADGIRWTVAGEPYTGEIVHVRNIAVPGRILGLSAIEAAMTNVDIGEHSQDVILRHFSQGAHLQYAFSYADELAGEAQMELLAQLEAKMLGPENAWRPIILDRGAKLDSINMTAEEAKYLELSQWSDARISGTVFHVDPTLLGIVQPGSQLTYSNAVDREVNLNRDAVSTLVSVSYTHLTLPTKA